MILTQVEITESGVTTGYAQYLPTDEVLTQWLDLIVQKVVHAPPSENIVNLTGSSGAILITRRDVTDVSITLATA